MPEPIVKHSVPAISAVIVDPILIPESPNPEFAQKEETKKEPEAGAVSIRAVPSLSPEEIALMAEMDAKEAIRAAAVLLYWASLGGSDHVSGVLVAGIAEALNLCADRLKGGHE